MPAPPFGAPRGGMPMPMPFPMPPRPGFPPYMFPSPWMPYSSGMPWGMSSPDTRGALPPQAPPSSTARSRGRRSQRPRFTRSVYQPDPGAERPEDSKPCRTLFVRNIAFEVDIGALRAEFESHGDISVWFDMIARRGMVFVTYYDTRAAESAKKQLNGRLFVGRALDVHFSLPKEEDQQQHCDRDKNQGTLFVVVENATEPLTDDVLTATFAPFGEIRSTRTYKDQSHARFVEYWDSRACVAAHDALDGTPFLGGVCKLKFAWDLATVSLVNDARDRSLAKAAAEQRAREGRQSEPADERQSNSPVPPPWTPSQPPPEERLEQAQKVQQVRPVNSAHDSF